MSGKLSSPLKFQGSKNLIDRIVLATLTGKTIRISHIRSTSATKSGLAHHEVAFLRLLEAITNGSKIEFSYTGTTLTYQPGLIIGTIGGYGTNNGILNYELTADCLRGITYFLLPLCLLAPFSKGPVNIIFSGPGVVTSATSVGDISTDTFRTAVLPLFARFGIFSQLELRIMRRSCPGAGKKSNGGEIQFTFAHQVRLPKTLHLTDPGVVKKVRGVAYSSGLSGSNNARMIESARAVLNQYVKDIYIFSDVSSTFSKRSQPDANKHFSGVGFGLSLVAETNTSCLYSADSASLPTGGQLAEDIGRECAHRLLDGIASGGCISASAAPLVLILMAMGSGDVGRLQLGQDIVVSKNIIQLARDLRRFGTGNWMFEDSPTHQQEIVLSIYGREAANVGRKIA